MEMDDESNDTKTDTDFDGMWERSLWTRQDACEVVAVNKEPSRPGEETRRKWMGNIRTFIYASPGTRLLHIPASLACSENGKLYWESSKNGNFACFCDPSKWPKLSRLAVWYGMYVWHATPYIPTYVHSHKQDQLQPASQPTNSTGETKRASRYFLLCPTDSIIQEKTRRARLGTLWILNGALHPKATFPSPSSSLSSSRCWWYLPKSIVLPLLIPRLLPDGTHALLREFIPEQHFEREPTKSIWPRPTVGIAWDLCIVSSSISFMFAFT